MTTDTRPPRPRGDESPLEAPKTSVRQQAAGAAASVVTEQRLHEHGRGRHAEHPTHIPWRGWKDILWRVYGKTNENRLVTLAAGVTFYCLLAIFPAIGALVSLYGLFNDPGSIAAQLDTLVDLLPGSAIDLLRDDLQRLTSHPTGALTWAFAFGLATSLWSANAGIKSIFDALNLVYAETEKRGLIRLNLISLGFTTGTILLVVATLAAMVALSPALAHFGLTEVVASLARISRWPLLFVLAGAALAVVYRYGPSRNRAQWRWVTPGGLAAAFVWLIASAGFSWYAQNFASYDKTYGSLGAVIGFMIWIWISAIVVLLGAEINAEMEHQTARDTTEPGGQPLGERGATMADTIGAAQAP